MVKDSFPQIKMVADGVVERGVACGSYKTARCRIQLRAVMGPSSNNLFTTSLIILQDSRRCQ